MQASYAPFEDVGETEARPLGQWQTVAPATESVAPAPVDLQLPHVVQNYVCVPAANVAPEPPVKKFKEKVVTSLAPSVGEMSTAGSGANEFKKRKGVAAKRNMRQRLDDD